MRERKQEKKVRNKRKIQSNVYQKKKEGNKKLTKQTKKERTNES